MIIMHQASRFLSSGFPRKNLVNLSACKKFSKSDFTFCFSEKPAGVIADKFLTAEFWRSSPRPDYIRLWGNFLLRIIVYVVRAGLLLSGFLRLTAGLAHGLSVGWAGFSGLQIQPCLWCGFHRGKMVAVQR